MPIISAFEKELAIFSDKLKLSENIVIIHHYNPDGDAIGSSLGLWHYLKLQGKDVHVIIPNNRTNPRARSRRSGVFCCYEVG